MLRYGTRVPAATTYRASNTHALLPRTRSQQRPIPSHTSSLLRKAVKGTAPVSVLKSGQVPLDAAQFELVRDGTNEYVPSKDEVAEGMGEMLATIHSQAGFDARDVEFVMSGAPKSAGLPRFYVIYFNQPVAAPPRSACVCICHVVPRPKTQSEPLNSPVCQMRAFNRDEGDVSELVDAFFVNYPYYSRPVPNDALYDSFKRGYERACSPLQTRAALFLPAIEAREAEKHNSAGEV